MKYLITLIIIVFEFSNCLGHCEYYAKGCDGNYEKIIDVGCQGPVDIYRPCALTDYNCIRNFLSSNSQCRPSFGSTPDPIRVPKMKFYLPVSNMTIVHTDVRIRGFRNARIQEFYLSLATGNIVISVSIEKLNLTSQKSYFTYQRLAKEPMTLADYNTYELDLVIYTIVIPKVPSLRLGLAEIYAHITNNIPRYYMGPKAYTSNDTDVQAGFASFNNNVLQVVKESNVIYSYFLMTLFIQRELCDFGINPYKDYLGFFGSKS